MRVAQGVDDCFCARAFFVALQEELGANDAVGADDVGAGVGNPARAACGFFVANPAGVDGFAADVGEQRVSD